MSAWPSVAVAEPVDIAPPPATSPHEAIGVGAMSPLLLHAAMGSERGLVLGFGGYDTSRRTTLFNTAVEVRVWGPIALRAGVTYSPDSRSMRPSVGARVQLLRQAAQGVDGTLSTLYKAEGFTESEGEIETTFAVGRKVSGLYLLGNFAYGQDPDGNERDGELRVSCIRPQGRTAWGLEARARSAIGPQRGRNSGPEPRFDMVAGPTAMISLSSVILFAEIGPSAVQFQGTSVQWGLASLGGIGSVF
jgi:hypothetical protein